MNYVIRRMPPDELRHWGIKGQKWGVRRYQNADGTLTEEGKARYYTDSERRSLVNTAKKSVYRKKHNQYGIGIDKKESARVDEVSRELKSHPIIQDSAKKVSNEYKEYMKIDKAYMKEWENFYHSGKTYEKYLNKAVDHFMKEVGPNWGTRQQAYDWFKYDDGDQGEYSSIELYKKSPEGKKLVNLQKAESESYKKYAESCKKYISDYLGAYGDEVVNPDSSYKRTVNSRLTDFVQEIVEEKYGDRR